MKTDLIIISVILVLLVFLPFYLLPILQHKGNKKFSQIFMQEAVKLGLNVDIKASWNLNITGIDSEAQKLLVVQNHDEIKVRFFNLKEVKSTELLVSTIPVVKNGKPENMLQLVEIAFSFYTKENRESLTLYDYNQNTYQNFEVKNAEKLHQNIKQIIMAHPVIKKTA